MKMSNDLPSFYYHFQGDLLGRDCADKLFLSGRDFVQTSDFFMEDKFSGDL